MIGWIGLAALYAGALVGLYFLLRPMRPPDE
jgi:hypothetical protein